MKTPSDSTGSTDSSLHELFVDELRDVLWAEKHLLKALPKMAKAAESEELKTAFSNHLKETEGQVERLQQVFSVLGMTARAKKCEAMEGLVEEGESLAEEFAGTASNDAALIAAGQKVEHYEIASYGTLCAFAKRLGNNEALELLLQTLEEEKNADALLTQISDTANAEANDESSEGGESTAKSGRAQANRSGAKADSGDDEEEEGEEDSTTSSSKSGRGSKGGSRR